MDFFFTDCGLESLNQYVVVAHSTISVVFCWFLCFVFVHVWLCRCLLLISRVCCHSSTFHCVCSQVLEYNLSVSTLVASVGYCLFCVTPEIQRADLNPCNMFRNAATVKVRFDFYPSLSLCSVRCLGESGLEERAVYLFSQCLSHIWDIKVRYYWNWTPDVLLCI